MATSFPTELEAIDTYVGLLRDVRTVMSKASRVRNPKQAADILGPGYRTLRVMSATLGDVFDRICASPRLRTVPRGYRGPTRWRRAAGVLLAHAGVFLHYAAGPGIMRGGGQPIADALLRVITDNGGQVLLRTQVDEILPGGRAVAGVRIAARPRTAAGDCPTPSPHRSWCPTRDLKRTFTGASAGRCAGQTAHPDAAGDYGRPALHVEYLILDRDLAAEGAPNTNWWVYPDDDLDRAYAQVSAGVMPKSTSALPHVRQPEGPRQRASGPPGSDEHSDHDRRTRRPPVLGGCRAGGPVAGESYRRNWNTPSASSSCTRP